MLKEKKLNFEGFLILIIIFFFQQKNKKIKTSIVCIDNCFLLKASSKSLLTF